MLVWLGWNSLIVGPFSCGSIREFWSIEREVDLELCVVIMMVVMIVEMMFVT